MNVRLCVLLAVAIGLSCVLIGAADRTGMPDREGLIKAQDAGNFKDAYEGFRRLALDEKDDPARVGEDLERGLNCLMRLGRSDESDEFREAVISTHGKNWRLLWAAARTFDQGESYGFVVAGKFNRGYRRSNNGRYVNSFERDRIRQLQLMQSAMEAVPADAPKAEQADFHLAFARMLLGQRGTVQGWKLQYLSDLTKLPDYEEGYRWPGAEDRGAPVNEEGTPVYHQVPSSWKDAKTDGERWRWCLKVAGSTSEDGMDRARFALAEFLRNQFDVQTMARGGYGALLQRSADETKKDESGPYAVSTLGEEETIARLANGIKRFKLPEEYNFVQILQGLVGPGRSSGEHAANLLAQIFEDRQQYVKAAEWWKRSIELYGAGSDQWKQKRLDQIIGNWAMFDGMSTRPAGVEPLAFLVFRNGKKVSFEARSIKVDKLLEDVKEYIKTKPKQLEWEKVEVSNIGWRLVQQNQQQYIGQQVAQWTMDLQPREKHCDRRVAVKIPIKQAGAYLIDAKMEGGNTATILLWIADTALVKKTLGDGAYCFVADAVTGKPIAKATVDFFGFQQKWVRDREYQISTEHRADRTDTDGQVKFVLPEDQRNYSWLITARTEDGRFAYSGFSGMWGGQYYDRQYNENKVFVMTDRPVYRPGQTVKFKVWLNRAQYDREGNSPFAGQSIGLQIHNPKNEKVMETEFVADDYGGLTGEFVVPKDATLGVYSVFLPSYGGGNFRVEEYKKPEFEVKVDAPAEPVMLGEKITATINAKYYFGAPVTSAKVKYKVLRSSHEARWYPIGRWDWLYEPGYWWFAYDYTWYPGWAAWGTARPHLWWFGSRWQQPEVVAENEVAIGPDGTAKVEIDTAIAKAVHGDSDHRYEITAEVTDQSRRTIVGQGTVLVARKPYKVYAWVDRGHYMAGDVIEAFFNAQTLAQKPVKGNGELRLFKVAYEGGKPVETEVQKWTLPTDEQGKARVQIKAAEAGQYRLSYTVTDDKKHSIEGGYVFVVRGKAFDGRQFRFDDIELVTDKREYAPGETVRLMVNTNRPDSTVVLFLRPANGVCLPPKVLRIAGKSAIEEVAVVKKDMPNFFIEAFTVANGQVYDGMREVIVPPEGRVVNVEVLPSAQQYKPGQKATVKIKLSGEDGRPMTGTAVVAMYDKALEYIAGGSNVAEIKSYFWKWRRTHYPRTESSLMRSCPSLCWPGQLPMQYLGTFGSMVADLHRDGTALIQHAQQALPAVNRRASDRVALAAAPMSSVGGYGGFGGGGMKAAAMEKAKGEDAETGGAESAMVQPTVRTNFADTALWVASVTPNAEGIAEVGLTMPENLTTWKTMVWAMSSGTRVGQGTAEVVTAKNLLVRLQAPRFFMQKDEVVLSANIHNYLKTTKRVKAVLELPSGCLVPLEGAAGNGPLAQMTEIMPGGEKRVDWRVKVVSAGEAVVRVSAITDEESDAMEMRFPAYVHGMLKTDSYTGVIRPNQSMASIAFEIPAERITDQSRLEIRYSPSVAAAMVDALPYLVDYPYGCTEQTLNRFVPTVITQRVLINMGLNLKDIQQKRTNLNAQEIGDDAERAADWKRNNRPNPGVEQRNPVFDEAVVRDMAKDGVSRLAAMQSADGGWGWFSGWNERSYPHTTAVVVHGLQIAKENDVALLPQMLEKGVSWLQMYQAEQVNLLKNAAVQRKPYKEHADNIDALVYMVLMDSGYQDKDMMEFLYRDRNELSVYGKAVFAMGLLRLDDQRAKLEMLMQNIRQYVVMDDVNQTAYLRLPGSNMWWCWYGSETEAMGYYLKLLSKTDPKGEIAPRLAKYMITNRKHASYWNSTRDTAVCIEALADYMKASGENRPDMKLAVSIDGKRVKEVAINASNMFSFDNKVVVKGASLSPGRHTIEFAREGTGPVYFSAYVTNFTLEDAIKKAGLEITVQRKFYKLTPVGKTVKTAGSRGQVLDQKVEAYTRNELADRTILKSGDLVEIELEIDSRNDYEYVMFEDMKAAGFEPVEVRSGYNGNDLGAYMELRDDRVCFFSRVLPRGKHSVAYRLRAETPGLFSALPTKVSAMYAPELKANSDEMKVGVSD